MQSQAENPCCTWIGFTSTPKRKGHNSNLGFSSHCHAWGQEWGKENRNIQMHILMCLQQGRVFCFVSLFPVFVPLRLQAHDLRDIVSICQIHMLQESNLPGYHGTLNQHPARRALLIPFACLLPHTETHMEQFSKAVVDSFAM